MSPTFTDLPAAAAWYEAWLRERALPLWSTAGVDAERHSFHERLSPAGKPLAGPRRARVQARQIWTFATLAAAGFGSEHRRTATIGLDFYLAHYLRPDGLFAFSADEAGRLVDDTAALYEQAFSLLALAALGRRAEARRTREALQALRHPAGGWREAGAHPFQANAHMHLLEAALAWEMAGDASWGGMADDIVRLALGRFIDPDTGVLREFFDAEWRALPDQSGGLVEPGHQFEWAWLLETWGMSRGEGRARAAARRLYGHGRRGVDPARRAVVGSLWSDGAVREPTARLWAQTEHLRAALTLGSAAEALEAANGLAAFLDTPVPGAWWDKRLADGAFVEEPAPATSFYHLASGLLPLLQGAR